MDGDNETHALKRRMKEWNKMNNIVNVAIFQGSGSTADSMVDVVEPQAILDAQGKPIRPKTWRINSLILTMPYAGAAYDATNILLQFRLESLDLAAATEQFYVQHSAPYTHLEVPIGIVLAPGYGFQSRIMRFPTAGAIEYHFSARLEYEEVSALNPNWKFIVPPAP